MKRILSPHNIMIFMLGLSLALPNLSHAFFQENEEHGKFVNHGYLINMLDVLFDLNLTEEQIKAFKELADKTRITTMPLRKGIKELRVQMDDNFLSEDIDTEKAVAQIAKMVELRSEISMTYLNAKLEGTQLLTPEQRTILLSKKKEWRDRFKNIMNPLKLLFK
ncbi:MAG: Spy/CpxP family protein refolding chaperone [Deltaproteobacteria bacterium]|nr:Spy/CpxP family protein refolding chaperone [Deltaproteobacteria bacterium]